MRNSFKITALFAVMMMLAGCKKKRNLPLIIKVILLFLLTNLFRVLPKH